MPFDPENPKDFSRLRDAVRSSRKKMEPFRDVNYRLNKQRVGRNYGNNGSTDEVPVNLIDLAYTIYMENLVSDNPAASVTTMVRDLKPEAYKLELDLTNLAKQLDLRSSLRRCVGSALTMMGIMKVGISSDPGGEPFCDPVTIDNAIIDMGAPRIGEELFVGDQYCAIVDDVRDNDDYDRDERKKVLKDNSSERRDGTDETSSLGPGDDSGDDDLFDRCTLRDIWIPRIGAVVTYWINGNAPLRIIPWRGPAHGPYILLGYGEVENNVMPLSPGAGWLDLHLHINGAFRKIVRQTQRQKTVIAYRGTAADDASRIRDSDDGTLVRTDDPAGVREIPFGGADAKLMAFNIMGRDLFNYMAGNLEAIGGLAAQSPTLGQDEMLSQSASVRMKELRNRTIRFAGDVMRALAWYRWSDPLLDTTVVKRYGNGGEVLSRLTAIDRKGRFMDYNFDIVPYTLQSKTPSEQLATLTSTIQTFVIPFIAQLQQEGKTIDFNALLHKVQQYTNSPDLVEIITNAGRWPENEVRKPPAPQTAANNYSAPPADRRSIATRGGQERNLMATLLGAELSPAQKNQMM